MMPVAMSTIVALFARSGERRSARPVRSGAPGRTRLALSRALLGAALLAVACENPVDDTANVLPTWQDDTRDVVPAGTGWPPDDARGDAAVDGRTADGADGDPWPAAYRVGCLEIRRIGTAGPDDFQTRLYDGQWSDDIAGFELNILPMVASADPAAGAATLRMASGVGQNSTALCIEPASFGVSEPGTWTDGRGPLEGVAARCTDDGDSDATGGTATLAFQLPADHVIYIYEQEHDGTTLLTRLGGGAPDALPLHGVRTTLVLTPDRQRVAGALHGCLRQTEATELCACLGNCANRDAADRWPDGPCAGAPRGSVPLLDMLAGVAPSEPCTTEIGVPSYDVDVRYLGVRLPTVPDACP